MPDRVMYQEHVSPWFGVVQQPTQTPDTPQQVFRIMHNISLGYDGMPRVRPGRQRINGAQCGDGDRTVYGMAVWRTTPADKLIIACGTKLQELWVTGGDPIDLIYTLPTGFGVRTGARTTLLQLGDRLFIINGFDPNLKYNGTNVTRMGLLPPTVLAPPTKVAGALVGQWKYQATLVSSELNGSVESEPTPLLLVPYANQQGTFGAPAVPAADPQVDRWNLYRNIQGGTELFKINLAPVSLGTVILDNLTDDLLQAGPIRDEQLTNSPPPGKFSVLCVHQGRLLGVTAEDANALYYSDLGLNTSGVFYKPESWPPANRIEFAELGGARITALVSFFEWLLVFQDFGVWSIRGVLADETAREISPMLVAPDRRGVGVSSDGNVAIAENKVYFAAKDGLWTIERDPTTAGRPELALRPVSRPVSYLYQQIDFSRGGVALFDRDQRRWCFWGQGGASQ